VTALIALVTAALGAGVGAWLQNKGAGLLQMRDRQLAACDEFIVATQEVFVALTAEMERLGPPRAGAEEEWLEAMDAATAGARANAHNVTRALARLELLFGTGSPAAAAAVTTAKHILEMTSELRRRPGDVQKVVSEYESAIQALQDFIAAARDEITSPAWRELAGVRRRGALPKG
jgi:ABC-type transporter Mla subunit MlaD